ncbi:(2Fe-2S)-binding protein [Mycobacterium sp. LTG2003]
MTDPPSPTGAAEYAGHLPELAALGGYFALSVDTEDRWRPLSEFLTDATIKGHVDRTRDAIAASAGCRPDRIPIRMAASSFQLGVSARLLSPVIGAALCFGAVPVLDNRSVRWLPSDGHAPQFAVTGPVWSAVSPTTSAPIIATSVVGVLTDLGARLSEVASLSARITLGNIASAANGAVTVLALSRPHLEEPGRELVRALLDTQPLIGTGSFVDGQFRRRSCCLYYQAPGAGLCGDCLLIPAGAHPNAAG